MNLINVKLLMINQPNKYEDPKSLYSTVLDVVSIPFMIVLQALYHSLTLSDSNQILF
jgi:hypothetical protein